MTTLFVYTKRLPFFFICIFLGCVFVHAAADELVLSSSPASSPFLSPFLSPFSSPFSFQELSTVEAVEMREERSTSIFSPDFYMILLISSSEERGEHDLFVQGFKSVIAKDPITKYNRGYNVENNILYTIEYLDAAQMQSYRDEYLPLLYDTFQSRYPLDPDLIIAVGDSAYEFMFQYHDNLFPSVPLLFSTLSVPHTSVFQNISRQVTGYSYFPTIAQTIGLAQRIHPNLTKMYVLTSPSLEGTRFIEEVMHVTSREHFIECIFAPYNQHPQELITSIQSLGTDAAVLLDDYHFYAEAGNSYSIKGVLPEIAAEISVPIYTVTNQYNWDGALGGYQIDLFTMGEKIGTVAISLLLHHFSSVVSIEEEYGTPVFHSGKLRALGLSKFVFPAGSVFIDEPKSTTEITLEMFIGIFLGCITFLMVILILLLWGEEIRRANRDISRQQALQEHVVSNLTFGFYVRDVRDGMKYLFFNSKMEEITGEKTKDVLKRRSSVPGTPIDEERLCIETKSVVTSEMVLTHADEMRILYYIIQPIIRDNDVIRIQGHALDITQRRKWELKLYESLELFHSFFEKSLYAVAIYAPVLDEDGTFSDLSCVDANPGFEKLFNVSRSEILGKMERDIFSACNSEYEEYVQAGIRSLTQKRTFLFENHKRGDVYISGYYFVFGQHDEYVGFTCSDTTRIVKLREDDVAFFRQIQSSIDEISSIREDIITSVRHIRELMKQEKEAMFGTMVIEQTYIIEQLLVEIDLGLVRSDKIHEFLRKHHRVFKEDHMDDGLGYMFQ